jgi:nickel-type superoxide dismutase maturation protease
MKERATASKRSPVPAVGIIELMCWLFRSRRRVQINGLSMSPALNDGDQVFVRPCSTAFPGDIVLCRHPYRTNVQIIKRVETATEDGLTLVGDNPEYSTDSKAFGCLPWIHFIGVVTARVRRT